MNVYLWWILGITILAILLSNTVRSFLSSMLNNVVICIGDIFD